VETLRAWLEAFGDVIAASAAMFVHPNTFRYRLRRLAEVGQLDLADPEVRFAAMLELRIVAPRPGQRLTVPVDSALTGEVLALDLRPPAIHVRSMFPCMGHARPRSAILAASPAVAGL
jgi:hypothetical protein